MRSAGAGLIVAALLALAGCKSTDPKSPEKSPTGLGAGRSKGDAKDGRDPKGALAKGPTWLDDVNKLPGAGTAIPKATTPTNPKDPSFDAKTASQKAVGGRVFGPDGQPARNVPVRIEKIGSPADAGAPIYIYANNEGYFFANGLETGGSYELSVSATTQDGKTYSALLQTKVPAVTLAIQLRDDLPPRADTGAPSPKGSDTIPPAGVAPITQPKPADAWTPGGPTNNVPPPTLGGGTPPAASGAAPATKGVPEPELFTPSPRPAKPENVADDPKSPFRPPVTAIPSGPPPVPPLPKLPPTFTPSSSGARPVGGGDRPVGKFTLLDALERPWESDSVQPGSVVLIEFATTACVHCPRAIPVLKDLQSRYGASGFQVMGVLCDDVSQKERAAMAAQYARDRNLNYAMYVEPVKAGSVRDRFDVEEYPHAVLLDSTGRMLWRGNPLDRSKLEAAIKQAVGK